MIYLLPNAKAPKPVLDQTASTFQYLLWKYISSNPYTYTHSQDKVLSKDEVLDSYDLFVGSQATEWGSYMMRHDEF